FLHLQIGNLQVGVEGEQRRAHHNLIALAHRERLDAAGLVRSDKDQIGFDPALIRGRGAVLAAGKHGQGEKRSRNCKATRDHDAFLSPNSMSMWACKISRTSILSKRPNRPFHISATMAGAARSCGNRASASFGNSPRATARGMRARIAGITRAMTS